jgi:hypothetical protein
VEVTLTEAEQEALIMAIHMTQDLLAGAADGLAASESEEDRQIGRDSEKKADLLDIVRRKLGDEWEPTTEFTAPDSPEGLST